MWPARFSARAVEKMKATLGSYGYAGQGQQRPAPLGGGIFKTKWWKRWRDIPADLERIFTSWDFSFGDTDGASYVVGQVWGLRDADRFLLDQVRQRADFVAAKTMMVALAEAWPDASAHVVEGKANGPAIIAELKHVVSGIIPWPPKGYKMESKVARAAAFAPIAEAGNVAIPQSARWISDWLAEFNSFPNAAADDQVDAFSQAMAYAQQRPGPLRIATERTDRGGGGAFG